MMRAIAWLSMLAMVLNMLTPALAPGHAGASRVVELCSAAGIKTVSLSSEHTPIAPDEPAHKNLCPMCLAAGAAVLPSYTASLFFSALQAAAPPATRAVFPPDTQCPLPASRGPPLLT